MSDYKVIQKAGKRTVWPAKDPIPAGWVDTKSRGTKGECSEIVRKEWANDKSPEAKRAARVMIKETVRKEEPKEKRE